MPGYNKEVFYGRVNCIASLGSVIVGLNSYNINEGVTPAKLAYYSPNKIGILFDKGSNENGSTIMVYNSLGVEITTKNVVAHMYNKTINTSSYAQGIYFIHINDNKNQYQQTLKFVK